MIHCISIHEPVKDTCNQWLANKGRHCQFKAGRYEERSKAENIRQEILRRNPRSSRTLDMLEDLATRVHCRNLHRESSQIQQTVEHWLTELELGERESVRTSSRDQTVSVRFETSTVTVTGSLSRVQSLLAGTAASLPRVENVVREETSSRSPTRPVTHSQAVRGGNSSTSPAPSPPPPRFRHRRVPIQSTPEAITDLVQKAFGPLSSKNGHIYMFRRDGDPGYVKIGWSRNVDGRLRQLEQKCHFKPILVFKSPQISNAYRIEQLIFTQLSEFRHADMRCRNEKICGRKHEEWFKLRRADAETVIRRWVEWAEELPYNEQGVLEEHWKDYISRWLTLSRDDPVESSLDLHFGCELPADEVDDSDEDSLSESDHETDSSDNDEASDTGTIETEVNPQPVLDEEEEECAICYEPLSGTRRTVDPCDQCGNHTWHDDCIGQWLRHDTSCPLCRGRDTIRLET